MTRLARGSLGLCVILGIIGAVTCKVWSAEDCPTKLLAFERRPCFPANVTVDDQACEAEGCTFCNTNLRDLPTCFNNTRPGLYWEADGRQDSCPSNITFENRVDCFQSSARTCTISNSCTQAFCYAIGCEWCKSDQGQPYCFYKTEDGLVVPQAKVAVHRNIGGTYVATVTRPALPRDIPNTPTALAWYLTFTFGVPVKDVKFGSPLANFVKGNEDYSFIMRPKQTHWNPFAKQEHFLLTATLDRQAPAYRPVARGRLSFDTAPRYAREPVVPQLAGFLAGGCVTTFEFDPAIQNTNFGKIAVTYRFTSEQSVLSTIRLLIQRSVSAILSRVYYEAYSIAYTQDYKLSVLNVKPDGAERSPGTFSMVMLYDSSQIKGELNPELAFMIQNSLPSRPCSLEYQSEE
ncbi:uncharacterized protein LOC110980954 [Acanthaster planci]|uniref:Uncharacterized protein LOC110980954 n=1 Tax=Acanthaster planci TaxID=133434 RepID=A0A8B7YKF2_ACAPL|nr:uncharacterized protein LOC110980954 [Acanthaster planci]XP_022093738.1 uncharacterized protein LOC110980954 [Acanthaster planci]XP_022093739.1 uncharacterized protein LOC110980954 [Acanthaster planci]